MRWLMLLCRTNGICCEDLQSMQYRAVPEPNYTLSSCECCGLRAHADESILCEAAEGMGLQLAGGQQKSHLILFIL